MRDRQTCFSPRSQTCASSYRVSACLLACLLSFATNCVLATQCGKESQRITPIKPAAEIEVQRRTTPRPSAGNKQPDNAHPTCHSRQGLSRFHTEKRASPFVPPISVESSRLYIFPSDRAGTVVLVGVSFFKVKMGLSDVSVHRVRSDRCA